MREIKFRLRYSETKEVVGYCDIWGGQLHYSVNNQDWITSVPIDMGSIRKRKGKIDWEQYTGLKDNNLKEIYEFDIVKQGDNYPSIIVFSLQEESPGFYLKELGYDYPRYHTMHMSTRGLEVIGNIYENPDLLTPSRITSEEKEI